MDREEINCKLQSVVMISLLSCPTLTVQKNWSDFWHTGQETNFQNQACWFTPAISGKRLSLLSHLASPQCYFHPVGWRKGQWNSQLWVWDGITPQGACTRDGGPLLSYNPRLEVVQDKSLTDTAFSVRMWGRTSNPLLHFSAPQLSKTSSEAKAAVCTLQFEDTTPTLTRNKHLELVLRAQCKCLRVLKGHLADLIPSLPSSLWKWNKCIYPSFKQNKQ